MLRILIILVIIFPTQAFSQGSPGGQSSNLIDWLRADEDVYIDAGVTLATDGQTVQQWNDQSTLNNNASQSTSNKRPLFLNNITDWINFNPVIEYANSIGGQEDYVAIGSAANLATGNSPRLYFFVALPSGSPDNSSAIFHGDWTPPNSGRFVGITLNSTEFHGHFGACRYGINPTNTMPQIYTAYYPTGSSLTTQMEMRINGVEQTESLIGGAPRTLDTQGWAGYVGAGDNASFSMTPASFWNGRMPEVIFYDADQSSTNKLKVESYLAIKYGITLATNGASMDYLSSTGTTIWDQSANTGYNFDIAGIARDDASNFSQLKSHSINQTAGNDNDIVTIANGTNFTTPPTIGTDLSYLIWGHNNGLKEGSGYVNFTTTNPETITSYLNRHWKSQESGTVGTVTLQFDMSTVLGPGNVAGANDLADIRLLVDADGVFTTGALSISPSSFNNATDIVEFEHNFASGTGFYFTIGSVNFTTASLPVELISFNAICEDNLVEITWNTATEINNDFFTIEKSTNGMDFYPIATVEGNGNTSSVSNYSWIDNNLTTGTVYYRLKQTDFDGQFTYHLTEVIACASISEIKIYPNPFNNLINIEFPGNSSKTEYKVEIRDYVGRLIFTENITNIESKNHQIQLGSNYESGVYLMRIQNMSNHQSNYQKIVKM